MKTHCIAGESSGTPTAGPDWAAYLALQERMMNCTSSFASRCLDEAADRILAGRSYKHTGAKLARCVERDCRGSTRLRRTQPQFAGERIDGVRDDACDPSQAGSGDLTWAATIVSNFLQDLPQRLRLAIAAEVAGATRQKIASALGIAERQYRNVRKAVLESSRNSAAFMDALNILRTAGDTGLDHFKAAVAEGCSITPSDAREMTTPVCHEAL